MKKLFLALGIVISVTTLAMTSETRYASSEIGANDTIPDTTKKDTTKWPVPDTSSIRQ